MARYLRKVSRVVISEELHKSGKIAKSLIISKWAEPRAVINLNRLHEYDLVYSPDAEAFHVINVILCHKCVYICSCV